MKMSTPAMWIRKNMLDSPCSSFNNTDRTLTEAEKKVQRSLQKLSIPEWYLNNNSRPPKILTNDSPIQSRPPVWKEQPLNKSFDCSMSVMQANNLTINRNGVLETEIGPPLKGPPKYKPDPPPRSPLTAKKRPASSQKSQIPEKKSSQSRLMNISRTFPRLSPSRKIQNINLVFPQSPNRLSQTIAVMDREDSELDLTKDSLEAIDTSESKEEEDISMSALGDVSLVSTSSEIKARVSRMPARQLTYIKPWKSPVTPEAKVFNADNSFKSRSTSTPQNSSASLYSAIVVHATPPKQRRPLFPVTEAPKHKPQPPPVAPRMIKSILTKDAEEMCDACKADVSKRSSPTPLNRSPAGFRSSSLCPIDEKRSINPRLRSLAAESPSAALFLSKKKSLENQMREKQLERDCKSLVDEIIEELNDKCQNSEQPTYVTPGSKNFVKKLVKALEKGSRTPNSVQGPAFQRRIDYSDEEVESSEDDTKSAAISTSISYKDTDSSDSELRSPTLKQNYSYDWNMNLQRTISETLTTEITLVGRDDDSVYWIPITKTKLPRTSSLLSMISRLSTNSPGQQSPCVSPIRQNDARKNQIAWGMTCRTSDYARTLRRIDETMVLDSGYSDQSRGQSSNDFNDDTWFEDNEALQNSSGNHSFNDFAVVPHGRRSRTLYLGRPFVI